MLRPPANALSLLLRSFRHVLPRSAKELAHWRARAQQIPDPELRNQALASLSSKRFHADGGTVYATAAPGSPDALIALIVAYQTISDYLDNLCDRSTSLDPVDFRQLHQAMLDSVTPGAPLQDYYRYRSEKEDGGYLAALVLKCQEMIARLPGFPAAAPYTQHLCALYCDLQVHKHVSQKERVPRLTRWFDLHREQYPPMKWWEFAAATGSTLGIFMFFLAASDPDLEDQGAEAIHRAYFPWVGGLHILLDYLIDQEEDRIGGDLNFVDYYPSREEAYERIRHFAKQSLSAVEELPDARFHGLVIQGLIGMYLSDSKVERGTAHHTFAKSFTEEMGRTASLFHWISRYYRRKYND